ncbi:hypothetical protein BJ170DRAFT_589030, partial [Xylariales sp. AK1849]
TYTDLILLNILCFLGQSLKVAAVVDWGQAGWCPAYWEYYKAYRVMRSTSTKHLMKSDMRNISPIFCLL